MKHLLLAACLLFASCKSDAIGLVGTAEFQGTGKVWSDGVVTVVVGEGTASIGVYGKASGWPFLLPVPAQVEEGMVYAINLDTGDEVNQPIGEPLPLWTKTVFFPGEAEEWGISFEGSYQGPGDTVPPIE